MSVLDLAVYISWAILVFYWAISSGKVKKTQKTGQKFNNVWFYSGSVFFILLFLISMKFFSVPIFAFRFLPEIIFIQLLAVFLTISGLIIAILAKMKLSRDWSSNVEIKEKHELKTTDIYKLSRHPIYTGITFMSFGLFLYTLNLSSFIFAFIMIYFMIYKLKAEEKILLEHFPEKYSNYKKRVKTLIPFVW